MTTQQLFFASLIGVIVISSLAYGWVERHAAQLNRDTRERIMEREARASSLWSMIKNIAIFCMVLGMLKLVAQLPLPFRGLPAIAVGMLLYCVASMWRAWNSYGAYSAEAPGSPAQRRALSAAIMISISEMALAGVVCWSTFAPMLKASGKVAPSVAAPGKIKAASTPAKSLWINESEALRMLKGKDAAYLEALVQRMDVRANLKDGRKEYRSDDIQALLEAGLPTAEELK